MITEKPDNWLVLTLVKHDGERGYLKELVLRLKKQIEDDIKSSQSEPMRRVKIHLVFETVTKLSSRFNERDALDPERVANDFAEDNFSPKVNNFAEKYGWSALSGIVLLRDRDLVCEVVNDKTYTAFLNLPYFLMGYEPPEIPCFIACYGGVSDMRVRLKDTCQFKASKLRVCNRIRKKNNEPQCGNNMLLECKHSCYWGFIDKAVSGR